MDSSNFIECVLCSVLAPLQYDIYIYRIFNVISPYNIYKKSLMSLVHVYVIL